MKKVLLLGTGNSCRSQIAEGYLSHFAGATAKIYSAGIQTHGVNPRAIQTMAEDGLDISGHTSNQIDEYAQISFDFIITVCDNAHENCPCFPTHACRIQHNFPDSSRTKGSEKAITEQFWAVREEIKQFCHDFTREYLPPVEPRYP